MDKISLISIEPLTTSQYVKPKRIHYKQNGIQKIWDLIELHESVCIILFHVKKKKLLFVEQFRPAVYYNNLRTDDKGKVDPSSGITIEFCAGIVDKNIDLVSIAKEEILEECGYDVPKNKIERIISFRGGVGVSGEMQTFFYAEVTDEMKVSEGGGNEGEGEMLRVIEKTIPEVMELIKQPTVNAPAGFLFGITWFLQNKAASYS